MSATAVCPEPLQLRSELSLGQLLARAHEDVHSHGYADCPVCGDVMAEEDHAAVCANCGSRLS